MKKLFTILLLSAFGISSQVMALDLASFSVEDEFSTTEFATLESLELEVLEQPSLTLPLVLESYDTEHKLDFRSSLSGSAFSIDDMDWTSFAWGFCCCPIGFFVVAINDSKEQDQKLSYWIGLAVNVALSAVSSGVSIVLL